MASPHPTLPDSANTTTPHPQGCAEIVSTSEFWIWRQTLIGPGRDAGALDWLLEVAAGLSRARLQTLRLHPGSWVHLRRSRRDLEHLWQMHLADSVPLQYLVGRCYWRNAEVEVGPAVLIPRPETEAMVDLGVALIQRVPTGAAHAPGEPVGPLWADLGTGSGCLAMGLGEELPMSRGLAVDVSSEALVQARRNLQQAGLSDRVQCIQGDWFGAVRPWWGRLHLVVANPPYIPTMEVDQLEPVVRDHEPRIALDGGEDGLAAIRRIAHAAPNALAPGGWLLMEHHHDQSDQVLNLLAGQGLVDGQSHRDLEGHRRFASARRHPDPKAKIPGEHP